MFWHPTSGSQTVGVTIHSFGLHVSQVRVNSVDWLELTTATYCPASRYCVVMIRDPSVEDSSADRNVSEGVVIVMEASTEGFCDR